MPGGMGEWGNYEATRRSLELIWCRRRRKKEKEKEAWSNWVKAGHPLKAPRE